MSSRVIIEQAQGYIAQRYHVTVDDAFELLRGYCRRNGLRLGDIAHMIIDETGRAPDLRAR